MIYFHLFIIYFLNCQMELAKYNHAPVCDYLSWLVSLFISVRILYLV